jgi:hypothetical protein
MDFQASTDTERDWATILGILEVKCPEAAAKIRAKRRGL